MEAMKLEGLGMPELRAIGYDLEVLLDREIKATKKKDLLAMVADGLAELDADVYFSVVENHNLVPTRERAESTESGSSGDPLESAGTPDEAPELAASEPDDSDPESGTISDVEAYKKALDDGRLEELDELHRSQSFAGIVDREALDYAISEGLVPDVKLSAEETEELLEGVRVMPQDQIAKVAKSLGVAADRAALLKHDPTLLGIVMFSTLLPSELHALGDLIEAERLKKPLPYAIQIREFPVNWNYTYGEIIVNPTRDLVEGVTHAVLTEEGVRRLAARGSRVRRL